MSNYNDEDGYSRPLENNNMNNNNSTTETYREEEFESPLGIKNLTISSSLSNNSTLLSKKSNSLRSNKSVKYQPQQQQQQPQSQPQPHQQLQQGEDQNNNISDADQLQFHQVDTQRQQLSKQFKMLNLGQQLNDDQELITEPVQQQAVQAEVSLQQQIIPQQTVKFTQQDQTYQQQIQQSQQVQQIQEIQPIQQIQQIQPIAQTQEQFQQLIQEPIIVNPPIQQLQYNSNSQIPQQLSSPVQMSIPFEQPIQEIIPQQPPPQIQPETSGFDTIEIPELSDSPPKTSPIVNEYATRSTSAQNGKPLPEPLKIPKLKRSIEIQRGSNTETNNLNTNRVDASIGPFSSINGNDSYGTQPMSYKMKTLTKRQPSIQNLMEENNEYSMVTKTPLIPNNLPSTPNINEGVQSSSPIDNTNTKRLTLLNGSHIIVPDNFKLKASPNYTLNIIVRQFTKHAERKLNLCVNSVPLDQEPNIIDLLSEGVDPTFDKIISSLGYIARRKPKSVTDAVMFWRKGKSELRDETRVDLETKLMLWSDFKNSKKNDKSIQNHKKTSSRSALSRKSSMNFGRKSSSNSSTPATTASGGENSSRALSNFESQLKLIENEVSLAQITYTQADRQFTISTYILWRVLKEVVRQTPTATLIKETGLEEIMYNYLRNIDPYLVTQSSIHSTNWNLLADLLGKMSEKNFLSVSDRFIADLEKYPTGFTNKASNFNDSYLSLLIHGMRYLQMSNSSLEKFEECADFLKSLAKFFFKCENDVILIAYCDVINQLLLSFSGTLTAEVDHPTWVDAIKMIYNKSLNIQNHKNQMFWKSAAALTATSLSVAPREIFNTHWLNLVDSYVKKLKPKIPTIEKVVITASLARLIWAYLYRYNDTLNNKTRNLENIANSLFQNSHISGKKQHWLTQDPILIQSTVQILRTMAFSKLNLTLENIVLPLMKSAFNGTTLENISHEKMLLSINAYICILSDYKSGERPLFPTDYIIFNSFDPLEFSNTYNEEIFDEDSSNAAGHEEVSDLFRSLLFLLDTQVGCKSLTAKSESNSNKSSGPSTPLSVSAPSLHFRVSSFSFHTEENSSKNLELFSTVISSISWCMSKNSATYRRITDLLLRNCIHNDENLANMCIDTLKVLITKKNPNVILTSFARTAFCLDEKGSRIVQHEYLTSEEFIRLLEIYVELLHCWLYSLTEVSSPSRSSQSPNFLYNVNNSFVQDEIPETKVYEELELKNIITVIDEVEGNGLFFLFSHDFRIRFLGSQILRVVAQFDEVIYDLTTKDKGTDASIDTEIKPSLNPSISKDYEITNPALLANKKKLGPPNGKSELGEKPLSRNQSLLKPNRTGASSDNNSIHQNSVVNYSASIASSNNDANSKVRAHNRMPSKFVAEFGTRVIQVLEDLDFFELIVFKKQILSEAENKRLAKLQHKAKRDTIIRLAESNHGVDSALWFKVFEPVLDALVKQLPIQIAIARSYSCIRLVQLYDQIFECSQSTDSISSSLIWDYMLYLKVACSSLTSTSEQKLHIPSLSGTNSSSSLTKTHGRKKSQQMFTVQHQKITSAKSIFKMTVPLLTTQNLKLKQGIVEGLSCLNINIFNSFLLSIENILDTWNADITRHKPRSNTDTSLRIEIMGILSTVTSKFAKNYPSFTDKWINSKLETALNTCLIELTESKVQESYKYQRLRKYFCVILESFYLEVSKINEVDRWIPYNIRRNSFAFMEQWCGYGRYTSLANNRYTVMMKQVSVEDNAVALQASLELQRRQLQLSAISCMATLCSSPISTPNEDKTPNPSNSFDITGVLSWIDSLFGANNDKINTLGRKALLDILLVNTENEVIVSEIFKKCYTHDPALENYFITLSEAFVQGANFKYSVYRSLALALFSSGSDNINVRNAAASLLKFTEMKFYNTEKTTSFIDGICCRSRVIYKRTLFQLSSHFATAHPEEKYTMISELTMLFHVVGSSPRRDILAVLLPWVQTVELNLSEDHPNRVNSLMVLYNFFEITLKFSHKIQNEVEALWVALGNGNSGNNVREIYNFIVDTSLEMKSPAFIECARQVIVSLASVPTSISLIDTLISNLEPKSTIPTDKFMVAKLVSDELPYITDLSKVIKTTGQESTFSLAEISIIFLVDLLLSPDDKIKTRLPLLLHLSFVFLDHQLSIVQDQACAMLIHLIHQYGITNTVSELVVQDLRSSEFQKKLWLHGDLAKDKNSSRIPDNMDSLVRNVVGIFEDSVSDIQQDWSRIALNWATSCKVMHIASRSFQVFRCLISFLDQSMLRDMLSCLANTVSDDNPAIQSFSMQILMTFNAITAELYSEQLIDFPQLFWSAVACLNTIHEHEFIEVLSTLSKFISKIDLDSEDTVKCLIATFPPKWEGRFDGLQSVIMIGLRSSAAYEPSLKLLDRLNMLKDSEIIGSGDYRILLALLANMPRFLHAQSTKKFPDDVINAANVLCGLAEKRNMQGLSRIITSLVKKRFRTKEDFLSQIVGVISRHFFPDYSAPTLVFLLGLLFNNTDWIKSEILDLLKHILRFVDLKSDDFFGLGADLLTPLLRLLSTEYIDRALEVLDETVNVSPSPYDKHYLMMSLGDSSVRKDYAKIATLFGIPESSGWSIPMPSISTARTRNNIHSVFSTCLIPSESETEIPNTVTPAVEEYQFDKIDYMNYNPIQRYPTTEFTNIEVNNDDSLSNMLAQLDNLDSFFTKDEYGDEYHHQYSNSIDTKSTDTSLTESAFAGFENSPVGQSDGRFSSNDESLSTLLGSSERGSLSNGLTDRVIQQRSSFRNSRKKSQNFDSIPLSNRSMSDYNIEELSNGSIQVSPNATFNANNNNSTSNNTAAITESDGIFRFDGLLRSSKKKVPKIAASPRVGSESLSPVMGSSSFNAHGMSPRSPRITRTPRSPYSKNRDRSSVFGRTNKKASSRLYSPTRESNPSNIQ
ncbi:hypothetical protein B5S29_g4490 [[Candida] boidinii]|nr:hypothetical protein B5S29_g4490 [[Candida] boidinii]